MKLVIGLVSRTNLLPMFKWVLNGSLHSILTWTHLGKKIIVKTMRYCHNFDTIVFLVVQLLVHLVNT